MTLCGSTNPSVELKLPPRMSSARKCGMRREHLGGREQFHRLHPARHLQLVIGAQIIQVLLARRHEQVALRTIAAGAARGLLEAGKKIERIERQANVDFGGELRAHASHALARGAAAQMRLALQHQDVRASGLGKMIGDACAHNSPAYNHHIGCLRHGAASTSRNRTGRARGHLSPPGAETLPPQARGLPQRAFGPGAGFSPPVIPAGDRYNSRGQRPRKTHPQKVRP